MVWWLAFSKYSKILVFTIAKNITFKEAQGLDQQLRLADTQHNHCLSY